MKTFNQKNGVQSFVNKALKDINKVVKNYSKKLLKK